MPNRAVLAGLLLALAVGGCARAVYLPEPREHAPLFEETAPPPPPDTTARSGGAMGTGT